MKIKDSFELLNYSEKPSNKNSIRIKQRELLDETIKHFNTSNRAILSDGFSEYSHTVNGGCAIGRKCSSNLALKLDNCLCVDGVMAWRIYGCLPNSLKKLGVSFLMNIQHLHDNPALWNKKGLSTKGKLKYNKIINIFELPNI